MSESKAIACQRFELVRREDDTGISGTGVVAYGLLFPDGRAVLRWDAKVNSTVLYDSIADLETIHGHGGKTVIHWVDAYPHGEYGAAWAELTGYVQQAQGDGTLINPVDLLTYMDELKRKATAPVRDWINEIRAKTPGHTE